MKLTTIVLMAAVYSATVLANQSVADAELVYADNVVDYGPFVTPATEQYKMLVQAAKHRRLAERVSAPSLSANEPVVIDVAVVIHKTWLDAMQDPLTKDEKGKYYENGAQFALSRIKDQFAYFNESLANQGVNAILKPAYYAVVENVITSTAGETNNFHEFGNIINCIFDPDNFKSYIDKQELCEAQGLERVRAIVNGQVDLLYYVREKIAEYVTDPSGNDVIAGESLNGIAAFYIAAALHDSYRLYTAYYLSQIAEGKIERDEGFFEYHRTGLGNAVDFSHGMGHIFGAMHNVSEAEPTYPDGHNRAYACGKRDDGTARINNNLESRKKTIMWFESSSYGNQHHRFFSDTDLTVDDDMCGASDEANNIEYVRINAPIVALNFDLPAAVSHVDFVTSELVVARTESTASLILRRIGNLTEPAHLSITAEDGSAWEQRDFAFGLQEVSFAGGEAEKTVNIGLLPRSEPHNDTEFKVVVRAAIGATYSDVPAKITIVSSNQIEPGIIAFESPTYHVFEGVVAQVPVRRTAGTDGDITFKVSSLDGTAISGTDYTLVSDTVTIADGADAATILVETTKRSALQGDRALTLSISDVTGDAALGQTSTTILTIADVIEAGSLAFASASASVVETGSAQLTINRTNGTDGEVTVKVQTVNGTAIAGTDYTAVDQTVTFADGQASSTVTVAITNRTGTQGSRYFDVQLSNASGAEMGSTASTRVSITDAVATGGGEAGRRSGGAMGWFVMLGMLLIAARRLKATK